MSRDGFQEMTRAHRYWVQYKRKEGYCLRVADRENGMTNSDQWRDQGGRVEEAKLEEVQVQESLLIRAYYIGYIIPSRKNSDEEKMKEDNVRLSRVKREDS